MGVVDDGDLVVDAGNSNWRHSLAHCDVLGERGIGFVDVGVSGGVWGLEDGYCLMVGGRTADVQDLQPLLRALAADGGYSHVGPAGAGHFTKMVNNGIEYGMMQAYAEGYEILRASDMEIDLAATFQVWRHGSVIRSWLLELLADALSDDPELDRVTGDAEDPGEGRWAVQDAIELAIPAPAIASALFARFASRQESSPAMRAVAILRARFGGHEIPS